MEKYTHQEISNFVSRPLFDEKVILKKDPSFPKITVVTPSYNQGEFLERAILSVLNQNYPNLEYIVIDGASSDGSPKILERYNKYLLYSVNEKNKGQAYSINKGFEMGAGNILAYINSDDLYLPGTFLKILELFNKYKRHDIIYGHSYNIDPHENILGASVALPFSQKQHFSGVFSVPQPSSFWRREVFEKVGGFNIENKLCIDWEFYAKCSKFGFRFKNIDSVFACFRLHPSSMTVTKRHFDTLGSIERRVVKEVLGREISKLEYAFRNLVGRFKYLFYKLRVRLLLSVRKP